MGEEEKESGRRDWGWGVGGGGLGVGGCVWGLEGEVEKKTGEATGEKGMKE